MPLEPWEIELKKQLSGDEARYQPAPKPAQPQPQPAPKQDEQSPKASKDSGTVSFVLTLLFLLAVTVFVYDHKTGGKLRSYATSLFKSRVDDEKPKTKPERVERQPEKQDQSEIKAEVDSLRKESQVRLDEISAKLQRTTDKVKALGLLVNENFNIIGQNIPDEFMFLNRDWTLDRSPKYLELTPEDKEYLQKYVREN